MGFYDNHLNSDASNPVAFIDLPCSRSNDLSPMIVQTISHYSVIEKLAGGHRSCSSPVCSGVRGLAMIRR